MPTTPDHPFSSMLAWLVRHAGYPVCRLEVRAERLLLVMVAAQLEELAELGARPNFMIQSRDGAMEAAQRTHAERRKLVHFRCDNSAKV